MPDKNRITVSYQDSCYFVHLFRTYSVAVVLAGNWFESISLTSSTALVTFLSDLFIEAFLKTLWDCLNILIIFYADEIISFLELKEAS